MIEQSTKLIKDNHKIYNKLKSEITKKNEEYIQDIPSIKELALNKLYELNSFCEKRGVSYFSELPISKEINSDILYWLNNGLECKNNILNCNNIENIKIVIPGITKLKYELIAMRNLKEYFEYYEKIETINLEYVYGEYYESYYKKYIKNYDASVKKAREFDDILNRDIEITDRLGLQQEFLPAQNFMCSMINIGNRKHIKNVLIHID